MKIIALVLFLGLAFTVQAQSASKKPADDATCLAHAEEIFIALGDTYARSDTKCKNNNDCVAKYGKGTVCCTLDDNENNNRCFGGPKRIPPSACNGRSGFKLSTTPGGATVKCKENIDCRVLPTDQSYCCANGRPASEYCVEKKRPMQK